MSAIYREIRVTDLSPWKKTTLVGATEPIKKKASKWSQKAGICYIMGGLKLIESEDFLE